MTHLTTQIHDDETTFDVVSTRYAGSFASKKKCVKRDEPLNYLTPKSLEL